MFDDAYEFERADVRFAHIQNLRRSASRDEFLNYFATVKLGVLDLAIELAIGESTRAAFAELHVGFGIEDVIAP